MKIKTISFSLVIMMSSLSGCTDTMEIKLNYGTNNPQKNG